MEMSRSIVFSSHRVEFLPYLEKFMRQSDIIILEEAPNALFYEMLKGNVSIEDYLNEEIFEFPKFSFYFCKLLKKLYEEGKTILQIEPYIEMLLKIYEMFSEWKNPSQVESIPELNKVYEKEKKATKALIDFYEISIDKPFNEVVEAVKVFAKADAERFRFRDILRADAILNSLPPEGSICIEAGGIHQYLAEELSKKLSINKVFLLEDLTKTFIGKKWTYPPGDILTLRYIFREKENEKLENLLSARALIYIMIIEKEEMLPKENVKTPHLLDEIRAVELVNKLSFQDCERIYSEIRFKSREKALKTVNHYISKLTQGEKL